MQNVNNIARIGKEACCGYSACAACCPVGAIDMRADFEGYLYPQVDPERCTHCGLCLRTCRNLSFYTAPQTVYACRSRDTGLRARSSSGGAFTALARQVIARGGYVCGAGYVDGCGEVRHLLARDETALDNLRRSKFVQSTKYDIYKTVKTLLDQGAEVLFTGTPCEAGGLRQYLRREYAGLTTCDLICGCVSSPKVYLRYIEYLSEKYDGTVVAVNFKDKREGWRAKSIAIAFDNGKEYYNSILDDDYVVSFHSRYNIRPSCFHCKYRSLRRVADITLGDFWAIEKYDPFFDDDKGTSWVMTNTTKGERMVNGMKDTDIAAIPLDINDYATRYNLRLHLDPEEPDRSCRAVFYRDLDLMTFDVLAVKHLAAIKEERKKRKLQHR